MVRVSCRAAKQDVSDSLRVLNEDYVKLQNKLTSTHVDFIPNISIGV